MKRVTPITSFNPEPVGQTFLSAFALAPVGQTFLSAFAIAMCLGCAATRPQAKPFPKPDVPPPAAAPVSKEKQEQLVREFEQRRDTAQLGAALDRWKQGDEAGTEALLTNLLERSPQHREARRALADLFTSRSDPSPALEHLLLLVEQDPADPQAHHSLGLLLQTLDRKGEALPYFERAVKLESKNELYLLSRDACREE